MKIKSIGELTDIAFKEDTRVLAAFSTCEQLLNDNDVFNLGIISALDRLDWRDLFKIGFSKSPFNERRSMEFLDTLETLCDEKQKAEIFSFINKNIPNAITLIHNDYRARFLMLSKSDSGIHLNLPQKDIEY
ncbi:MAG: hypothetical protein JW974_02095 [Alphaproteobacteria bacterium]|nr:hypothetical protein [Alphaproteobacteria bacterium]MBN2675012.1 hypothetical protein [Alphaproteobacteria bacterium]